MNSDPQKENDPRGKRESFHTQNIPPAAAEGNVLSTALRSHRLGFVPMPVGSDKRPLLPSWKWLQEGKISEQQVTDMFARYPNAGVALLTGIKGFAVIDIDDPDLAITLTQYLWDKTLLIGTKNAGLHIYVREDRPSKSSPLIPGVADIKAIGGYVVAPPSPGYHRVNEARVIMRVENAREWAAQYLSQFGYAANAKEVKPKADPSTQKVRSGVRNDFLASLAGFLRSRGLNQEQILEHLKTSRKHDLEDDPADLITDEELARTAQGMNRYPAGSPSLTSNHKDYGLEVKSILTINAGELQKHALAGGTDIPFLPLLGKQGYIPKGWSTLIAGAPKVGKTELIVTLLQEWNDNTSILFITEEPQQVWERRLVRHPDALWGHVRLAFGIGANLPTILRLIDEAEESIIVIDSIRNVLGLEDENNNSEVALVLNPIIKSCRGLDRTLIMSHHIRKGGGNHGEGIAGGHAIFGAVDVGLEIVRDENSKNRRLVRGWGRIIEVPELLYEMAEDKTFKAIGDPKEVELEATKTRVQEVVDDSDAWLKTNEVHSELGDPQPSKEQVRLALMALAKEGKVLRDPNISIEKAQGKKVKWASKNIMSDTTTSEMENKSEKGGEENG